MASVIREIQRLRHGNEDKSRRLLSDVHVLVVANDADDLVHVRLAEPELDRLADWISSGKVRVRRGLVQHGDLRRCLSIASGERAAGAELNAKRPDVILRDVIEMDDAIRLAAGLESGDGDSLPVSRPDSGVSTDRLAARTPGVARTRSSTCIPTCSRAAGAVSPLTTRSSDMVSTWLPLNPRSTARLPRACPTPCARA